MTKKLIATNIVSTASLDRSSNVSPGPSKMTSKLLKDTPSASKLMLKKNASQLKTKKPMVVKAGLEKPQVLELIAEQLKAELKPYLLRQEFQELPELHQSLRDSTAVMTVCKYKMELLD